MSDNSDNVSNSSRVDTDPHWPPSPGVRAALVLVQKLGEREDGNNAGEVVIWACRRWCSREFWDAKYPAGKMFWCAGAVSSALAEAGVDMSRVGSVDADALLDRMRARWGVVAGEPAAGDVVWFQDLARPELRATHVGIISKMLGNSRAEIVSGNHHNAIGLSEVALGDPRIICFVRIP